MVNSLLSRRAVVASLTLMSSTSFTTKMISGVVEAVVPERYR